MHPIFRKKRLWHEGCLYGVQESSRAEAAKTEAQVARRLSDLNLGEYIAPVRTLAVLDTAAGVETRRGNGHDPAAWIHFWGLCHLPEHDALRVIAGG